VIKNNHPGKIKEIRGMGLMLGIELSFKGQPVVEKMLEEGVLVNCTNKKVIRLLPPLIITRDEADLFLNKFTNVIETLKI
jgi:acetylornithine/succinyldiaminopimelate/putrescine aminotransferase